MPLSLFNELKRRNVFKVSAAYIVLAWLILQVADVFSSNLGLPEWAFKLAFFLLLIGFPIALVLAWAYDLTAEGIQRTESERKGNAATQSTDSEPEATSQAALPINASVAVLPFVNMSGSKDNEYFSDGLAEELLNVLAQISSLKVAARTSSFHFKGHTGDIADIARSLGVASVLEGSVRQSGNRVRITAQLINASDGYHLWSKTYDRELDDIFAVQDEIASSVAVALKVKLLGEESDFLVAGGTNSAQAFQKYLQGVHFQNRGSDKVATENAISSYQEAIGLDPKYAQAYAGLAFCWDQLATNSFIKYEDGLNKSVEAAEKAIELKPDLADGHLVLGRILLHYKLDQQGARKAITTALNLNPGNSEVQIEYARISSYFGDVQASVSAARRALELDPVSLSAHHFLGHVLYFGRLYDEAIPVFRHVLELDPQFPRPRYTLGMCLYMQGHYDLAIKEVAKEPLGWMMQSGSAILLHKFGRIEEAESFLDLLIKEDDQEYALYQQGQVNAQWGNVDQAIRCLNRAYDFGDPGLSQLLVDPLLDPIRNDLRFTQLLTNIGFNL